MARWERLGTRGNVQDRRGLGTGGMAIGGLGGVGLIVFLLITLLGGGSGLDQVMDQLVTAGPPQQSGVQPEEFQGEDDYEVFTETVLGSTDEVWTEIFASSSLQYVLPTLVLFRGSTQSACGGATSAVGPHYCPLDETIYLDETFFDELTTKLGAEGGDVAEAYVIAHEVGHHVQNQLGILPKVQQSQRGLSKTEANQMQVRVELQADCFAGVWANHSNEDWKNLIEPGDIEAAMKTAAAIGDDRLQKQSQGYVIPDSFTHGSSEQRQRWFQNGFKGGTIKACNTFAPTAQL
ncbi:MAG TPA: neutral zinc metallopeptidase [Acidimicrobiia bacterium]